MLKEAWLFGKLQTIGGSEAETRAEEDAKVVGEKLSLWRDKWLAENEDLSGVEDGGGTEDLPATTVE